MRGDVRRVMGFIDGAFRPATSDRVFENRSPVDGQLVSLVEEASEADVDCAVQAAKAALDGPWGRCSIAERCALLHEVAAGIEGRFEDFLSAEIADTGKPEALARAVDIPRGAANFRFFADLMRSSPEELVRQETGDGQGAINYTVRRPRGVVAVVSPWNLPLLLLTWKVAPALACGNTVVAKPSEETPSTAALLGEVMAEAGIPPGVYNTVNGFGAGSTGEFLTRHRHVAAITFTGETRTGEAIMAAAATGLRDLSAELGGKNAALIFEDCDLEAAVAGTARSVFTNCGQVCLCTERVYVARPIFEDFVARLKAAAESLVMGHPRAAGITMGPLISRAHREKVLGYYALAREDGARIVTGGGVPMLNDGLNEGAWIEPTIWTGLSESSRVVREEIFGPCCHVQPFDGEAEAVALANDSPYGLAATVWTQNLARAHRVPPQLDVGIVWVNCWNLRDLRTPFGGAKHSGIGREGGRWSLDFYSEIKNVCIKL